VIPIYVPDTSALLKRYFEEAGSARVDWLFSKAQQGILEICLLSVVYYEVNLHLNRVGNAIRNRSTERLPLLRSFSAEHASADRDTSNLRKSYNMLRELFEEDMLTCKSLESYFHSLPSGLHLFESDIRVVEFIRKYSIGVNDALILVCLLELVHSPLVSDRSVHFMCADKRLLKAAAAIEVLQIEPL
jgi:predicted nucleic acid-binding protein